MRMLVILVVLLATTPAVAATRPTPIRSQPRGEVAPGTYPRDATVPLVGFMFGLSGLVALGVIAAQRRQARTAFGSHVREIDAALVRSIALRQQNRAMWMLAVAVAVFVPLITSSYVAETAAPTAIALGLGIVSFATVARLGKLLRSLHAPDVAAFFDGDLHLFGPDGWLSASPRQLERARKAAVPTAKIR